MGEGGGVGGSGTAFRNNTFRVKAKTHPTIILRAYDWHNYRPLLSDTPVVKDTGLKNLLELIDKSGVVKYWGHRVLTTPPPPSPKGGRNHLNE
jgi:hypothetical protein